MTDEAPPTVLVVDDEESVAEVFALWLEEDYDVRVATEGAAALEALDDEVRVVLLDRRMPGLSGDEVLERIRERGHGARVAMVTAVDPDLDILEMEFDDYLTKPVSKEGLHETVERLLALNDYDDRAQQHFALAQKLVTIEEEKPRAELQASEEYTLLRSRMDDIREEMDDLVAQMDEHASARLFRGLKSDSNG